MSTGVQTSTHTTTNQTGTQSTQNDQKSGKKDGNLNRGSQGGQGRGGGDFERGPRNRIYIGRLPHNVRDEEIRDLCRPYGVVTDVKSIPKKGIAFVTFNDPTEAQYAIYDLMEKRREYRGDKIFVQWAKPEGKKGKDQDGENGDEENLIQAAKGPQKKGPQDKEEPKKEEKPARPLFSQFQQPKPSSVGRIQKQKKEKVAVAQNNQPRANQTPQHPVEVETIASIVPEPAAEIPVSSSPHAALTSSKENQNEPSNQQKKANQGNKQSNKQGTQQQANTQHDKQQVNNNNNNKQQGNNKQNAQVGAPANNDNPQQGQAGQGKNKRNKQNKQNKNAQQTQQNAETQGQPTSGSPVSYTIEIRSPNGNSTFKAGPEVVDKFLRPLRAKMEVVVKNESTGEVEHLKVTDEHITKYISPLLNHAHGVV